MREYIAEKYNEYAKDHIIDQTSGQISPYRAEAGSVISDENLDRFIREIQDVVKSLDKIE
jgi:hypothetical protein